MSRVRLHFRSFIRLVCVVPAVLFFHLTVYSKAAPKSPKAKLITKFPFILTSRGIIVVKGQFAHFPDTLNFILDTGSGGISLDSATAKHFNLTPATGEETIKGIAQKKDCPVYI